MSLRKLLQIRGLVIRKLFMFQPVDCSCTIYCKKAGSQLLLPGAALHSGLEIADLHRKVTEYVSGSNNEE